MSRTVEIKGDRATFPGNACVHCLRPATHPIEIAKIKRYAVRKVVVPYCDECAALRRQKTHRQVLFERAAIVNSALLAITAGAWMVGFASSEQALQGAMGWTWGLLLGVLIATIVFGALYLIIRPWSRRFRSQETIAAMMAVTIRDFSWETTTLEFADEEYADRFAEVNRSDKELGRGDEGKEVSEQSRRET